MTLNDQSLNSSWSELKKRWSCDPHFRRLYDKINELVKKGFSQEEILKTKL